MKKIGLTGGIGAGKTYLSKIFKKLGIPVFNADIQAKESLTHDIDLRCAVVKYFGEQIYKDDMLKKDILAKIVFNDKDALYKLNSLVHPVVKEKFDIWCKSFQKPIVIKEAAILFESDSHLELDAVICVSCPKKVRIERIKERDNMSIPDIKRRIDMQIAEEKKEALSDYIINNNGHQLLLPQILNILKEIG